MRSLAATELSADWTAGVAEDKVGVEDFGTKTGALTDWAGKLGAASVVGEDCSDTLVW